MASRARAVRFVAFVALALASVDGMGRTPPSNHPRPSSSPHRTAASSTEGGCRDSDGAAIWWSPLQPSPGTAVHLLAVGDTAAGESRSFGAGWRAPVDRGRPLGTTEQSRGRPHGEPRGAISRHLVSGRQGRGLSGDGGARSGGTAGARRRGLPFGPPSTTGTDVTKIYMPPGSRPSSMRPWRPRSTSDRFIRRCAIQPATSSTVTSGYARTIRRTRPLCPPRRTAPTCRIFCAVTSPGSCGCRSRSGTAIAGPMLVPRSAAAFFTNEDAPAGKDPLAAAKSFFRLMSNHVQSGSARTALDDDATDYYPLPLEREALRPGVIYADPYGHVMMVVRWVRPDTGTRRVCCWPSTGSQTPRSGASDSGKGRSSSTTRTKSAGPGFKAFRPVVRGASGKLEALDNKSIGGSDDPAHARPSNEQARLTGDAFYARMGKLINPRGLDAERAYRETLRRPGRAAHRSGGIGGERREVPKGEEPSGDPHAGRRENFRDHWTVGGLRHPVARHAPAHRHERPPRAAGPDRQDTRSFTTWAGVSRKPFAARSPSCTAVWSPRAPSPTPAATDRLGSSPSRTSSVGAPPSRWRTTPTIASKCAGAPPKIPRSTPPVRATPRPISGRRWRRFGPGFTKRAGRRAEPPSRGHRFGPLHCPVRRLARRRDKPGRRHPWRCTLRPHETGYPQGDLPARAAGGRYARDRRQNREAGPRGVGGKLRGRAASYLDAAYAEAGAKIVPDAAALYGQSDIVLKVRQPMARPSGGSRSGLLQAGRDADQLHLAGAEQGAARQAGGAQGDGAGDGRHAPHHPRAEAWTRCRRWRTSPATERSIEAARPFRPLLPGPDHGRRAGEPAQVLDRRRRRRGAGGHRGRQGLGAQVARLRHPPGGARAGGEPRRAVRRVRVQGGGRGGGRLREGDERGLPRRRAGADRRARASSPTSSSPRRSSRANRLRSSSPRARWWRWRRGR